MLSDCDSEVTISSRFTFRPVLNTFYLVGNNITLVNIILLTIITCVTLIDAIINMVIPKKYMVKVIIGNTNYQFSMCTQPIHYMSDRYIVCVWLLPYCLLPAWLALQWLSHCAPTPSSKSHLQYY